MQSFLIFAQRSFHNNETKHVAQLVRAAMFDNRTWSLPSRISNVSKAQSSLFRNLGPEEEPTLTSNT